MGMMPVSIAIYLISQTYIRMCFRKNADVCIVYMLVNVGGGMV